MNDTEATHETWMEYDAADALDTEAFAAYCSCGWHSDRYHVEDRTRAIWGVRSAEIAEQYADDDALAHRNEHGS